MEKQDKIKAIQEIALQQLEILSKYSAKAVKQKPVKTEKANFKRIGEALGVVFMIRSLEVKKKIIQSQPLAPYISGGIPVEPNFKKD